MLRFIRYDICVKENDDEYSIKIHAIITRLWETKQLEVTIESVVRRNITIPSNLSI